MDSLALYIARKIVADGKTPPPDNLSVYDDIELIKAIHSAIYDVIAPSPFLTRLIQQDEQRLQRILRASPDDGFASLYPQAVAEEMPEQAKPRLRQARQDVALALAIADLLDISSVDGIIRSLSNFADLCVEQALCAAWCGLCQRWYDGATPVLAGMSIIAMGKHGAHELNYSSDIDLIAIYDVGKIPLPSSGAGDVKHIAAKLIQGMVEILNQQTHEGLVFRTDMRLRPNPGATPVAVSIVAAEEYYQVYGQNWERAAFIKARPCAGDKDVGQQFMKMMRPFVWRRTLDYGAVADIHAVKEQIHAEKGSPALAFRGANVKLGPGGIREIEFFAQTQQLLLGGRDKKLRSPRTVEALKQLSDSGYIDVQTANQLIESYNYLRMLEHRLQMKDDAQTHTIPINHAVIMPICTMMGYQDIAAFEHDVLATFRFVHDTYAELFSTPKPSKPVAGSLVFTGVDDDPRTLETLRALGFVTPEAVTSSIRLWHGGALRATRSVRARELLTALVPRILSQLGQLEDPDEAFQALNIFLSDLPGGFQIFALFTAHEEILDKILVLCQSSPDLVRRLACRPALVEGFLKGFDAAAPNIADQNGGHFENYLDEIRRTVNEYRVRISAGLLLGQTTPAQAGQKLSQLADRSIESLVKTIWDEYAKDAGGIIGGLAVLGFGRLGQQALTPRSDLDLVFIYDNTNNAAITQQAAARIVRRIISALSVQTSEGELFTIDMKLRPSGGAGPTAVALTSFEAYYQSSAWVWEQMALTKARIVSAPAGMREKLNAIIDKTIRTKRDTKKTIAAVQDMRQKLVHEKPARNGLDVKRIPGGLTDIGFIVQTLQLIHGAKIARLQGSVPEKIRALAKHNFLSPEENNRLIAAYKIVETTIQYLRAAFGLRPPVSLTPAQLQVVNTLLGESIANEGLDVLLAQHALNVIAVYERVIGPHPALLKP